MDLCHPGMRDLGDVVCADSRLRMIRTLLKTSPGRMNLVIDKLLARIVLLEHREELDDVGVLDPVSEVFVLEPKDLHRRRTGHPCRRSRAPASDARSRAAVFLQDSPGELEAATRSLGSLGTHRGRARW